MKSATVFPLSIIKSFYFRWKGEHLIFVPYFLLEGSHIVYLTFKRVSCYLSYLHLWGCLITGLGIAPVARVFGGVGKRKLTELRVRHMRMNRHKPCEAELIVPPITITKCPHSPWKNSTQRPWVRWPRLSGMGLENVKWLWLSIWETSSADPGVIKWRSGPRQQGLSPLEERRFVKTQFLSSVFQQNQIWEGSGPGI